MPEPMVPTMPRVDLERGADADEKQSGPQAVTVM